MVRRQFLPRIIIFSLQQFKELDTYTAKIYGAITSPLPHKCCTLNLTTTSLHLIVAYQYLLYSTTTTLQRNVVFSMTFLIYFVVAENCRYNYNDLLYTANMYIYATTYLSYKRCNLILSTTIRSRPLFVVLSYRWTTTKVLHICRTKDII